MIQSEQDIQKIRIQLQDYKNDILTTSIQCQYDVNTINSILVLARPVHIAIMFGGGGSQSSRFILVAALSAHICKVLQIYRPLPGEE